MSNEAINWAFSQPIKHSTAKFILVVMANHAPDGDWLAWPSVASLAEATGQDRKTVLENLKRLTALGYIEDTGGRKGATKQVPIYRLNNPKTGTVKQSQKRDTAPQGPHYPTESHYVYRLTSAATGQFYIGVRMSGSSVENDDYMGSGRWPQACRLKGVKLEKEVLQKFANRKEAEAVERAMIDASLSDPLCMNSPKTGTVGTVPDFPTKSPVFPHEQYQNSVETVPKTGHGIINEPSIEPSENHHKPVKVAINVTVPDWIPGDAWLNWVEYRKTIKAPLTPQAAKLCIAKLELLRSQGSAPQEVIDQSIMSGKWTGLFPIKTDSATQVKPGPNGANTLGKAGQATARNMEAWLQQKLQGKTHA